MRLWYAQLLHDKKLQEKLLHDEQLLKVKNSQKKLDGDTKPVKILQQKINGDIKPEQAPAQQSQPRKTDPAIAPKV